jgi:hypothetical protein
MSDPYIGAQQDTDQPYPRFGDPVNQFGGCVADGQPISCSMLSELVNSGLVQITQSYYLYNPRNPNGNFQHGTYQHYEQRLVQSSRVIGAEPMPGDHPTVTTFHLSMFVPDAGYAHMQTPQNPKRRFDDSLGPPPPVEGIKLNSAIKLALAALQNPNCRKLFGSKVDPVQLLTDLSNGVGGSIVIGNAQPDAAAQTEQVNNIRMITNPNGTQTQQKLPDTILMTFPANSYLFGASLNGWSAQQNLAASIIHELGHAANYIYGNGASSILQGDAHNFLMSQKINQLMVLSNCFR